MISLHEVITFSAVYNVLIYLFVLCKYIYLGIKCPVNIGLGILNLHCLFTF